MATAAKRFFGCIVLVGFASILLGQSTHSVPLRLPPTRSGAGSYVKIGDVEYVSASDLERRYGLRGAWLKKDETFLLQNEHWKIEFDADSREVVVNGLRLFLSWPCRIQRHVLCLSKVDTELILGPILRPGYLQQNVPALRVIAIDPGHGGVDNGTSNAKLGMLEKTFALDVSIRLARLLRTDGYKVILTRETDTKVELPIRAAMANASGADLFVSVHFNSLMPDVKPSGSEFYTFPPAGVRSAESWGRKDDDAEKEFAPINKFDHWNSVLAYAMQREVLSTLKTFDRGKKFKHLGVLRSVNCPGILVETGFLSNDAEAKKIATPEYRQQIAEAIASGIRNYAATLEALRKSQAATPPATQRTN